MADKKELSAIEQVRKDVPKSLPELERQPLHQGLIALAGIMAIVLAPLSFFITLGVMSLLGVGLGGSLFITIMFVAFDLLFGFLLLYCFTLGKRKQSMASWLAVLFSILIIPLGGFAGVLSGCMGLCGGAIGLLRRSALLPESMKVGPPVIDDIFLMYKDGRLIKHYTRRLKPSIDQDILSSMLVAVQDFVKDSFERSTGEGGALDEMKFGEFKIVIGRGKWIIIAALVLGEGAGRLKVQISKAVNIIEKNYESLLIDWDGTIDRMRPLNKEMKDLIDGEYDGKIQLTNA